MNVEVTLICSECGTRSQTIEGRPIDRYEYHDAPFDGIDAPTPPNWVMELEPFGDGPGFVLCPEHRDQRAARLEASLDAWRRRVHGGVR